jgi:hypothetical protein
MARGRIEAEQAAPEDEDVDIIDGDVMDDLEGEGKVAQAPPIPQPS